MNVLDCSHSYALEQLKLESEFVDTSVTCKQNVHVVQNAINSGRPPTILRRSSKATTLLPSISKSFHHKYRYNKAKMIPPTIKENATWEESKDPKRHVKSLFNSLSESVNSLSAESDEPDIHENMNDPIKSLLNSLSDSVKSLSGESEELDSHFRDLDVICLKE